MYLLNGKPLSPDRAFTHAGVQYPANWLRNATPVERAQIGITEAPDPPVYDQRFYWGPNNPKQLEDEPVLDKDGVPTGQVTTGLKTLWSSKQKEIAQSLLNPTDWVVIRGTEDPGKPVSSTLKNYRKAVRSVSTQREAEIQSVTTVEELVEILQGQPTVYDPVTDSQVPNPGLYLTPWPDVVSI